MTLKTCPVTIEKNAWYVHRKKDQRFQVMTINTCSPPPWPGRAGRCACLRLHCCGTNIRWLVMETVNRERVRAKWPKLTTASKLQRSGERTNNDWTNGHWHAKGQYEENENSALKTNKKRNMSTLAYQMTMQRKTKKFTEDNKRNERTSTPNSYTNTQKLWTENQHRNAPMNQWKKDYKDKKIWWRRRHRKITRIKKKAKKKGGME